MSTYWKQKVTPPLFISLLLFLVTLILILRNSTHRTNIRTWEKSDKSDNSSTIWGVDGVDRGIGDAVSVAGDESISFNKFEGELVVPIKLAHSHLSIDDELYMSKTNPYEDPSAYSFTGNFRRKDSSIWDSHPQYSLNAFGHHLLLKLESDSSFIHNDLKSSDSSNNDPHLSKCFYKGHIDGDPISSVAVSLCDGMTGHIKTSFGSLLISPYPDNKDHIDLNNLQHKITRQKENTSDVATDTDVYLNITENNSNNDYSNHHHISKRSLSEHVYIMEILVAYDESMVEFHKHDLQPYILNLMSIVNNIFSDPSIGNSIHVSVKKLIRINNISRRRGRTLSAGELLKEFAKRLKGQSFDAAVLLTRNQICRDEKEKKCDTLGLAEVGNICKPDSCGIVQDNGLPAGFTIAHELGHLLNMPHDDDPRCVKHNVYGENSLHIMSSTMGLNIHPWSWSRCSRHHVSEFLEMTDTSCLGNEPDNELDNPALTYTLDEQCQLTYGKSASLCEMDQVRSLAPCKTLWCSTGAGCASSNIPWADGTPCAKDSWCQKGKCVSKNDFKPETIDGGWGPWSDYSHCSLTCGGGVQQSERQCNNPIPQGGGKYCTGNRKKYRSCNTYDCPPDDIDIREEQCNEAGRSHNMVSSFERPFIWVPKYGSHDKCKLYCRVSNTTQAFTLQEKVKDGTPCSFSGFHKCVNGICRQAGCDNELNSNAKLDRCGVCEGQNNTCVEKTGNFYKSDLATAKKINTFLYRVTTIPKGAANIIINQHGLPKSHYIVLRDDQGKIILNNVTSITTYKNVFFYAGVAMEYSGSSATEERVNSTYARKINRDLTIEILSFKDNKPSYDDPILISYSYTFDKPKDYPSFSYSNSPPEDRRKTARYIPEKPTTTTTTTTSTTTTTTTTTTPSPPTYIWHLDQWSTCDSLCNGKMYRHFTCVNLLRSQKVPEQYCSHISKPNDQMSNLVKQCNEHCNITWSLVSSSECSASCGGIGTRENSFQCIQTFSNNSQLIIDNNFCADIQYQQFEKCESDGCWEYSEWSQCNASCGPGVQTREVQCKKLGRVVDRIYCKSKEESKFTDTAKSCMERPCYVYSPPPPPTKKPTPGNWITSEWGKCEDDCTKSRVVQCNKSSSQGNCLAEKKPKNKMKCCHYKNVLNWTDCSVPCGTGGIRTRVHFCAKIERHPTFKNGRTKTQVDPKYCANLPIPQPAINNKTKSCKLKSCKWKYSNWSQCTCNEPQQRRHAFCVKPFGESQVDRKYCSSSSLEDTSRSCLECSTSPTCQCNGLQRLTKTCKLKDTGRECSQENIDVNRRCTPPKSCFYNTKHHNKRKTKLYPKQCSHIRNHTGDGEYTLVVRGKRVRIYCHNMNSSHPKEYITVNETVNYSIFENRCQSFNNWNAIQHNAGQTFFKKIAINIHQLQLITNDFSFAQNFGNPQLLASAGDCYHNNPECPRGEFSVNLEGTDFKIDPRTKWEISGNNSTMKFSQHHHEAYKSTRGFCGGYCSLCRVSDQTKFKLVLDV